jgi:hypothetical protein
MCQETSQHSPINALAEAINSEYTYQGTASVVFCTRTAEGAGNKTVCAIKPLVFIVQRGMRRA